MSANLQEVTSKHQLEVILPDYCILKWHHAILCGVFVTLFLFFSYLPVSNGNTWNSVMKGVHGEAVAEMVPLSQGIRHIEIGWASNRLLSLIYQFGGTSSLSFVFAVLQTTILACWSVVFFRLTRVWWSTFGAAVVGLSCLPFWTGLTSHTFGQLALAILAILFVTRMSNQTKAPAWETASRWHWIGVATLFCVWANLDASFVIGVLWLLCFVTARIFIVARQSSLHAVLEDRELQSRVWLLELALAATLINPNGWSLWGSMFWWPDNPFLQALGGGSPTLMASWSGATVLVAWAGWVAISRKRNLSVFWHLMPVVMTVGVAFGAPMVVWFTPLIMVAIFATVGGQEQSTDSGQVRRDNDASSPLRFAYTLVAGLLLWIGFSFSPWSSILLGGTSRNESQLIGTKMPIKTCSYLQEHGPTGMLLCPIQWSDWVQVQLNSPVFVNSDLSLVPSSVVDDYRQISSGEANWQRIAEKYALNEILIEKETQRQLVRRVRQAPGSWKIAYEDSQAILLTSDQ